MCWVVFAAVPAGRRAGGGSNSAAGKETATYISRNGIYTSLKMFTWSKITHVEKKSFSV